MILTVDDDQLNIKLLGYMLSDRGYSVQTATNGMDALASVSAQRPDLILLDVMMPTMDGFEVLERLKGDAATRSIPVVMLTSLSDDSSRARGASLGAIHFLSKPTQRKELLAIVDEICNAQPPESR